MFRRIFSTKHELKQYRSRFMTSRAMSLAAHTSS